MTRKQTIKFLNRKKSQLENERPPHEVIQWIRVSREYIKALFGEHSEIYKSIMGTQILTPNEPGYHDSINVMRGRMKWVLEDGIELIESGSIDHKFDKNFLYRLSDAWITVLLGLLSTIIFSCGVWYDKTIDNRVYKIELKGNAIKNEISPQIIVDSSHRTDK